VFLEAVSSTMRKYSKRIKQMQEEEREEERKPK